MNYQTILVNEIPYGVELILNRVERRNAINDLLISDLMQAFDQIEREPKYNMIIIKGQPGFFCTGMDFQELNTTSPDGNSLQSSKHYMGLLKRFSLSPKVVISAVDGQVMAGGVGLVAASDLVVATNKSQFSLSEALWGLLPANVMPYLIRRIGFQKAYMMTLTTQTITAQTALEIDLIDEINDNLDDALRKLFVRISRLHEQTIRDLKVYFRKLWIINESTEEIATNELARLLQEDRVKNNLKRYVEQGKFPWDKA